MMSYTIQQKTNLCPELERCAVSHVSVKGPLQDGAMLGAENDLEH